MLFINIKYGKWSGLRPDHFNLEKYLTLHVEERLRLSQTSFLDTGENVDLSPRRKEKACSSILQPVNFLAVLHLQKELEVLCVITV
jgi:hypothetical protein